MNRIINFYLDDTRLKDELGFTFSDVISSTDEWLEECHGHIQWMFPLEVPSTCIPNVPLLDSETIFLFNHSNELKDKMKLAYIRMCNFYGMAHMMNYKKIDKWVTPNNHNFLRLTRMMRSMKMLMSDASHHKDLFDDLTYIYIQSKYGTIIGERTYKFWSDVNVETFNNV